MIWRQCLQRHPDPGSTTVYARVVAAHTVDDPPLAVAAVAAADGVRDNPGSPS